MKLTLSILALIFCLQPIAAQEEQASFHPPVGFPIVLSGNFAELRRNHFHTGIDIKTGGVEGKEILAADEGVVRRISISPWGYGKAIYIEHPNGYTTVYGHLKSLSSKINEVAKAEQYARESFTIDFQPDSPIPVERGEVIALSGNTGGSGGPHLHFEVRRTSDSRALNPLHFGFKVRDRIAPRIRGVRFHPLSDTSLVNGATSPRSFIVQGGDGNYHLKAGQRIQVYGAVGLSLHAIDFLDDAPNKCGIYALDLKVDGEQICRQQFDEIDFATSRQINCYKDYEAFRNQGWHYHKSYREPGNQLPIYPEAPPDEGTVFFPEKGSHTVEYTATDAHGNKSILTFVFESLEAPNGSFAEVTPYDAYFTRDQPNSFAYGDEIFLDLPAFALYRDLPFKFGREVANGPCLSPAYSLHHELVPLDKAMEVKINLGEVPVPFRDRLTIARYNATGAPAFLPGIQESGFMKFSTKDFGRFCLQVDSVAPELEANKYSKGGSVNAGSVLGFKIGDDRSGIAHFEGRLNGKWVLMEYEPKKKLLFLEVKNSPFQKGSNTLEIRVRDHAGNESKEAFTYVY